MNRFWELLRLYVIKENYGGNLIKMSEISAFMQGNRLQKIG